MDSTDTFELYKELAARHGRPDSKLLPIILRKMVTPEQANILLQLPADADTIAVNLGMEKDLVNQNLQELYEKGIAFPSKKGWRLGKMIDSLHDLTLSNKKYHESYGGTEYYNLWQAFAKLEWWPGMVEHIQKRNAPFMRVIPAVEAVKDHPELLPEEDLRELYKKASSIALIPCPCRMEMHDRSCNTPDEMCIAINRSAEYHFKRGVGKRLTPEEAVEFDKTVRKHNSFAVAPIAKELPMVICNCHDCCCDALLSFKENNADIRAMHIPSRFLAVVNHENCIGCQKCLEACNYDAVSMRKHPGMKKWKAYVDPDMCMGCGTCVVNCPKKGAMSFDVVRPPEHVLGLEDVDIYSY